MNQRILIFLLALTLIASCSKDTELLQFVPQKENKENPDSEAVPVRLFGSNIEVIVDNESSMFAPMRRVNTAGQFENNDLIGLFVTNINNVPSGEISVSNNNAYNDRYKYVNGEFISVDEKYIYQYKKNEKALQNYKYRAFFPYNAHLNPLGGSFYVNNDQSSLTDRDNNDIAFAETTSKATTVDLQFKRQMCLITIIFNKGEGTSLDTDFSTTLTNIHRGIRINLNANEPIATITDDAADAVVCHNDEGATEDRRSCSAIIPAQTLAQSANIGTVRKGTTDYQLIIKNDITLEKGHHYIFEVSFKNNSKLLSKNLYNTAGKQYCFAEVKEIKETTVSIHAER